MDVPTRRALLGAAAAAGAATGARAAPGSGGARAAVQVLERLRAESAIPAVSAAVVRQGKVVWADARGLADVELGRAADVSSRFRIGSCAKVVTALAAARLAERGVLDLDRPIGAYRPSLPAAHHATTVRQLLGHLGGVRHYGPADLNPTAPGGTIEQRNYRTTDDSLALFVNDKLIAPPGEVYHYSTFGFTLVSAVMESAAGGSFLDIVRNEVSVPLGLQLAPDIVANLTPGRVRPYQPAGRYKLMNPLIEGAVVNAPAINPAYKWAGGGFIARPTDLALLGAATLAPGYLQPRALASLFQVQAPSKPTPKDVPVGLAWRVDKDGAGRVRHHHAGAIEGGRAGVCVYPEAGMSVALASNLGETPGDVLKPIGQIAEAFGL